MRGSTLIALSRTSSVLALSLALIIATAVQVDARKGNTGGGGGDKAPKTMVAPSGKLTKQPLSSGKPTPGKPATPVALTATKKPKNNPKGQRCLIKYRSCTGDCKSKKHDCLCLSHLDKCLTAANPK